MSSVCVVAPASQNTGIRLHSTAATGSVSTFSDIKPASRLATLCYMSNVITIVQNCSVMINQTLNK